MFQYKFTIFRENNISALTCINWYIVLPEVGKLVPEHDANVSSMFELIN
jgi:hypothetical protein